MKPSQKVFKLILSMCVLSLFATISFAQGIDFEHGTWKEARKKAKKEKKSIMVDAYTDWCGPCKWMSKEIFPQEEAGEFFNKNFVSIKIDMEKGEGKDLAKEWKITSYPTMLFFDSKGKLLHRAVGARDVAKLIQLGQDALDPKKQIGQMIAKYEKGNREADFLFNYLNASLKSGMDYWPIYSDYRKTQTDEQMASAKNWEILKSLRWGYRSRTFKMVRNNEALFIKNNGEEDYNKFCLGTISRWAQEIGFKHDTLQYDSLPGRLETFNFSPSEIEQALALLDYGFYYNDPVKGPITQQNYLDNFNESPMMFNNFAWNWAEKYPEDREKLNKALEWANKSIEGEAKYYNIDTKAFVLKQLGRYEEALKVAREAIAAAEEGEDVAATEDMIKEIEQLAKQD